MNDGKQCINHHDLIHMRRGWCCEPGCNEDHLNYPDGVCRDATEEEVAAAILTNKLGGKGVNHG